MPAISSDFGIGDRAHAGAAVRLAHDQAFLVEHGQRGTDMRAVDAVLPGEVGLDRAARSASERPRVIASRRRAVTSVAVAGRGETIGPSGRNNLAEPYRLLEAGKRRGVKAAASHGPVRQGGEPALPRTADRLRRAAEADSATTLRSMICGEVPQSHNGQTVVCPSQALGSIPGASAGSAREPVTESQDRKTWTTKAACAASHVPCPLGHGGHPSSASRRKMTCVKAYVVPCREQALSPAIAPVDKPGTIYCALSRAVRHACLRSHHRATWLARASSLNVSSAR